MIQLYHTGGGIARVQIAALDHDLTDVTRRCDDQQLLVTTDCGLSLNDEEEITATDLRRSCPRVAG
jgi:hypothetical protein